MSDKPRLEIGQRIRHRTGKLGEIVAQPDGDPIVRFDGESHDTVCYRSEVVPYVPNEWDDVKHPIYVTTPTIPEDMPRSEW